METKEITLQASKTKYGKIVFYPKCDTAKQLLKLLNKAKGKENKTITINDMVAIADKCHIVIDCYESTKANLMLTLTPTLSSIVEFNVLQSEDRYNNDKAKAINNVLEKLFD